MTAMSYRFVQITYGDIDKEVNNNVQIHVHGFFVMATGDCMWCSRCSHVVQSKEILTFHTCFV